jgi:hypothetical protein
MRGPRDRLAVAGSALALSALVPAVAAAADPALVQPLISGPAPPRTIELPFGGAELSPSSLIAADGAQRLDVSVELDGPANARELVAVLYAPPGRDPRHGGAPVEALVLDAAIGRIAGSATASDLTLRAINPPPGALRLDLVARDRERARLLASARIPVHAQHRLPPGVSPSDGGALAETSASPFSGLVAGELGPAPDALPGGAINSNLTATAKGFEAEAYVAMQPNDPNRVIAASNPGSFKSNPPAFISDGGLAPGTVTTRTLPSAAMLENGTVVNMRLCCDPALAADRDGNLWYAVLSLGKTSHIVINRVAAGTAEFQPVSVAIPRNGKGFQDKEMIAIDSWPQSPKYGRLYAAWVENRGRRQNVVVSECDTRPDGIPDPARCDNPANWTPGGSLPAISDKSSVYTYPSIAAAPNGDVYVVWWNAGRPPAGNEIEIDSCPATADCRSEASWGADATVDDLFQRGKRGIPFFCPIRPAPGGRVGPQTYVEVGPDGTVYVAYSDLRNNGKLLCTGLRRDRTFDSFIAASPSPNAYPVPNTGVRLSDDGLLDRNHHFFPTLAIDQTTGEIQSSLYSTKQDPTQKTTLQYYVGSTDLAATFSPMIAFSTATSNFSGANSDGFDYGDYEGADAAQGVFVPVWTDNREGLPKSAAAPGEEGEPREESEEEGGSKPKAKFPRRPPDVFALTPAAAP